MNKIIFSLIVIQFLRVISSFDITDLDSNCLTDFQSSILSTHNFYRSFHLDTPNLLYNDEMANTAQNFATYLASFDKFEHSNTTNGENIAGKYSFLQSAVSDCTSIGSLCTSIWYGEVKSYSWAYSDYTENTSHFSQVVWKSSVKIGCGLGVNYINTIYKAICVCEYDPPGDYVHEYIDNVKPFKSSETLPNLKL